MDTIVLSNLPAAAGEEDVRSLVSPHGRTLRVWVSSVIRGRRFAVIRMASDADGIKAQVALGGYELDGTTLRVRVATPDEANFLPQGELHAPPSATLLVDRTGRAASRLRDWARDLD
jgi:hypothetical protein